jgi:hypothetical protein
MEKEKRKPQLYKSSLLLYIGMTLLGCAICFGSFLFWILSDDCTWNKWDEPNIGVPSSSQLISEQRIKNSYAQSLQRGYEDNALDEENLKSFFETQGLRCSDSSCRGNIDFWGTAVRYHVIFQPTNSQPNVSVYWLEALWTTCPARWDSEL